MEPFLAILPLVLLFLLCPLMMLFMHRGGDHQHSADEHEELMRLRAESQRRQTSSTTADQPASHVQH